METFKLKIFAGSDINSVASEAKKIAKEKGLVVEFDFNEIKCLVSEKTVVDWLVRDYMNAHIMEWKTVGHDCKMSYDNDTEIELRTRQLARAKRWKAEAEERQRKDSIEKAKIDQLTKGVDIEIIEGKEKEYADYVANNSKDGYSRGVIDYSEAWAKLMQVEISKGKTVKECAENTQEGLGYLGITGFMYGCAVQGLANFWKHGEELRKWHNKEYGVSEDKEGVVNPAILTIG